MSDMPVRPCTVCMKGSDSHERCSVSQCPMRKHITAQIGDSQIAAYSSGQGVSAREFGSDGCYRKIAVYQE